MLYFLAAQIGSQDIWETKLITKAASDSPCCLTVARENFDYQFCPSCGKKMERKLEVQGVTRLGSVLGATKNVLPENELFSLLAPLAAELGLEARGPRRVEKGKPPCVLIGVVCASQRTPDRNVRRLDVQRLAATSKEIRDKIEKVVGARKQVHLFSIE